MIKLTMNRPALVRPEDEHRLAREFGRARRAHHALLDFEAAHQAVLDETQAAIVPRMAALIRIVGRLRARPRRHPTLAPRAALLAACRAEIVKARKARNDDPRWREACRWPDGIAPECSARSGPRRKALETDEQYAERCASRRTTRTRRESYQVSLYAVSHVRACTWCDLQARVKQAVQAVLSRRAKGLPSEWRRPRWDEGHTLIIAKTARPEARMTRGPLWWEIDWPLYGGGSVPIRAKFGNWHDLPSDATIVRLELSRRRRGHRWRYSVSALVEGMPDVLPGGGGVVGLDWGHREHGHGAAGIRAFVWHGDDGRSGEVLIPERARLELDRAAAEQARTDLVFDALQTGARHRRSWRRQLERAGVRTADEQAWMTWDARQERRILRALRRAAAIRTECYRQAVRELRRHYGTFVFEDIDAGKIKKKQKATELEHRKRQNRDLSAPYMFRQIAERSGADCLDVDAAYTSRTCSRCGYVDDRSSDVLQACTACGAVVDRDVRAAENILRRGQEALAKRASSA